MIRFFFGSVLGVVAFIALISGISFLSFKSYEFYAPKYRAVDAKVFKESEQYNDGMIRDLSELQRQYVTADDAGKAALKPIIIHRFAVYDETRLPADLRAFYVSIKSTTSF